MSNKPEYGTFLDWRTIKDYTRHLHDVSIQHLINIWPTIEKRTGDVSFWGDEVEYQVIHLDETDHEAHLVPRQEEILQTLESQNVDGDYQPEFTKYMVESSPSQPYTGDFESLLKVEASLTTRRKAIASASKQHEYPFTLSLFPLLGVPELAKMLPVAEDEGKEAVFKEAIASVGRHQILQTNLQDRSGRRYEADVPLFLDVATGSAVELRSPTGDGVHRNEQNVPCIHLEDIIFAMGGCGLQATFQANTLADVRTLHDQLCVLGPITLALTAATPIYKGMLADTDARWNQACRMVDDRRPDEMATLSTRWSCSPTYISHSVRVRDGFQHPDLARDQDMQTRLEKSGVDPVMARYFANLHQRDPLVLFAPESGSPATISPEEVHQSICGSVWSHVRLKLPMPQEPIDPDAVPDGWRVEFRPMEVQLTDFANAAFLIFMQLLRQTMLAFDLDMYMPLELVEENMNRAHAREAVVSQEFWFPRTVRAEQRGKDDIVPMSIDEIINGPGDSDFGGIADQKFEGLIPLIRRHLDSQQGAGDVANRIQKLDKYLAYVSARACGREKTPAQWQRDFVRSHPDYSNESIVTPRITYDMLNAIKRMTEH